jgi:hypothetical protein
MVTNYNGNTRFTVNKKNGVFFTQGQMAGLNENT